jgi:hypothetical protein
VWLNARVWVSRCIRLVGQSVTVALVTAVLLLAAPTGSAFADGTEASVSIGNFLTAFQAGCQPYAIVTIEDGKGIATGDYNPEVGDCMPPMPPPPPLPTSGGQPVQPTATPGAQVHSGQSGRTSATVQPTKTRAASVATSAPAALDAAGPTASGAAQPAQRYASAAAPGGSGAGWLWWVGLTVAVVLGAGLTAFFGYRRRKLSERTQAHGG